MSIKCSSGNNTTVVRGGITLFNVLGVVFIVLKIMNIINWSWWFVLMPLYLSPLIIIVVLLLILLIAMCVK